MSANAFNKHTSQPTFIYDIYTDIFTDIHTDIYYTYIVCIGHNNLTLL